jgi:flagellar basal-body rod modification protein FlgD
MVDAINTSAKAGAPDPVPAASLAKATGGNKEMGQEAFLKLLVAQLKNQDPLKPQDNYEFVAQLAQFSSLEQTIGINDRLDQLSLQNQGLQNSQVVSLVGKQATVKGNIVTLNGQGSIVPVNYTLDAAASQSTVIIRDAGGRSIRTLQVGPRAAGSVTVQWNGKDDNGLSQPAGPYQVLVTAKGAAGGPVALTQKSSGLIQSVSFDQGFPVIQLDSGVSAPVGDLLQVSPAPTTP